jgi:hypothetical protein
VLLVDSTRMVLVDDSDSFSGLQVRCSFVLEIVCVSILVRTKRLRDVLLERSRGEGERKGELTGVT